MGALPVQPCPKRRDAPPWERFHLCLDGDAQRELLDQTRVDKYGTSGDTRLLTASGVHSDDATDATPSLSGNLLGDWRGEVSWPTSDDTALSIYSTPTPTGRRVVTLLHDIQDREAWAWQNAAHDLGVIQARGLRPTAPSFAIGRPAAPGAVTARGTGGAAPA